MFLADSLQIETKSLEPTSQLDFYHAKRCQWGLTSHPTFQLQNLLPLASGKFIPNNTKLRCHSRILNDAKVFTGTDPTVQLQNLLPYASGRFSLIDTKLLESM